MCVVCACGHAIAGVCMCVGLAKTILQGTVKGERKQVRQRKRWEDNTREWTGLDFAKSQNRSKWRTGKNGGCEIICDAPTTLAVEE